MIVKKQVRDGFERSAKTYEQSASLQARVASQLAEQLHGISAEQILEIGCGSGLLSRQLVALFPQASLLLTDIAPAMLAECKRSVSGDSIAFRCMDGEALDPELPQYDLIVSSMTLHWFQNIEASLAELQQKLTQGGRLVVALLGSNSLIEWREICTQFNVPLSTPLFPRQTQLAEFTWTTEIVKITHQSLHAFLRSLKAIGAVAPRANYQPLSATQLRKIMRQSDREFEITYEVLYGEYQRA